MKIPDYSPSLKEQLAEFDIWVTPSLGEIRDTDRFSDELDAVVEVFEIVSEATDSFADESHVSSAAIAKMFLSVCDHQDSDEDRLRILMGLASLLFLVTGKSDNNSKCQIPLFLREHAGWSTYPAVRTKAGKKQLVEKALPRVLKAEMVMKNVVALASFNAQREKLLSEFIQYVLAKKEDVSQLWSIGKSYSLLKQHDRHKALLTPLVVFQVRGSVSATGGHGPENLLRSQMTAWGLQAGVDFNTTDVIVGGNGTGDSGKSKTRAYDFVLPYRTIGWSPRIFVQCQFYAGDSGSVSHKNVDQTSSSRLSIRKHISDPVFIEYVDGAGYFSSLNGDLASLLSMSDTASFIQIRTAIVRLRREFQQLGFLTPLEVAHACLRAEDDEDVLRLLVMDGYQEDEVSRAIEAGLASGLLIRVERLTVSNDPDVLQLIRASALLDTIARHGLKLDGDRAKMRGFILVPGYGPFFGMPIADAIARAADELVMLGDLWESADAPSRDLQWLVDRGHAMFA